ncbi:amino acid adenylation domain-containing protein [Antarctobacter heliothermus]|uniref:Amino acid adenylation domain-containing protein n=1 Tax=Antarctobacter heliothermus TaxID=74033 RepID=A0A239JM98_9RHOB|nr:amino acid adenylation domain-containing protein [Antarctobacter heliothermus]SNT07146.1 amino acid adenylation domain-containing protein [Antarctobacter heliothermus]
MTEGQILFLICSERSGSNLIRAMMDAHPKVSAPQPLHLIRDVIVRADALVHGDRDGPVAQAMLQLVRERLHKQFPAPVAAAIAARIEGADPFVPREILRALYGGILAETGSDMVMVKENELHEAAAQIIDAFPDARFVFQTRDPRDYLSSAVALKTGAFGNKFGSFRNAMQVWASDQRFGLRMLGHFGPNRVFLQRYEDLVADPEGVLRDLCRFAGFAFEPEMLEFHQTDTVKAFSTRKDAWKNLARPVMSGNFNKYRNSLSRRQIVAVESMVGPLMDRLGYKRDHPQGKAARWPIVWPSLVEPLERWTNKEWSPFYTVANTKHHADLDRQAAPVLLPYAGRAATEMPPGQRLPDLAGRLVAAAGAHGDRPALCVDGENWSYERLFAAAADLASHLTPGKPVVAVYAARHASAYLSILATVLAGGTYVPLNCRFPDARNREILRRSGATHLMCGAIFAEEARRIAEGTEADLRIVDQDPPAGTQAGWTPTRARPDEAAYILFTSGSTGTPKGVAISQTNLGAYLDNALALLTPTAEDRFSQTFDLTFDLSVHDLFVTWSSGAALCVPSASDLADPAAFLAREGITQWFSVPTLASTLHRGGALKPGAFPALRCALFCGEALPSDLATAWQRTAPQARIENWYGPTEATIACLRYDLARGPGDQIVPIGTPFPGMTALVVDKDGNDVPEGEIGTLHLGGAQVAAGYLNDPERTERAFVTLPDRSGRFYDTGDLVSCRKGILHFHGRSDFQAKIRGYRVELGEIEAALRPLFPGASVVALTWPPGDPNATHVIAAAETEQAEPTLDRATLKAQLPDYMIPSSLFGLPELPKNASGKIDRPAIARTIEERLATREAIGAGSFEARVLDAVLRIKPTLSTSEIRTAENLLMAGMDSLDFVNLTMVFAEDFGVELDETRVALLANLSFADLVDNIERGQDAATALAAIPGDRIVRANRALAFLNASPAVLSGSQHPLVLAFGSSGTMRAIDTVHGDAVMRSAGRDLRVLNIGLPALTARGLARMARHLAEVATFNNVAAVLHEFDPVLLSTVPPKGDVELDDVFYASAGALRRAKRGGQELDWAPELRGMLAERQRTPGKAKKPLWERERDHEIAAVYRGEIPFDENALRAWRETSASLAALGAPVLGWVHPIVAGPTGGSAFDKALADCETAACPRILRPDVFDLAPDRFLNINHVAPGAGMRDLTDRLMREVAKDLIPKVHS